MTNRRVKAEPWVCCRSVRLLDGSPEVLLKSRSWTRGLCGGGAKLTLMGRDGKGRRIRSSRLAAFPHEMATLGSDDKLIEGEMERNIANPRGRREVQSAIALRQIGRRWYRRSRAQVRPAFISAISFSNGQHFSRRVLLISWAQDAQRRVRDVEPRRRSARCHPRCFL
jgi:hypothetical protein